MSVSMAGLEYAAIVVIDVSIVPVRMAVIVPTLNTLILMNVVACRNGRV